VRLLRVAAATLLAVPACALAQEAEETPICTDRPTKANAVCTVPVGKWQLESSAAGWARTEADGQEWGQLRNCPHLRPGSAVEASSDWTTAAPDSRFRGNDGFGR